MSPQDFEKSADELCIAAKDLYSTIGSPFEGDQIMQGYRAHLHLPVSNHSDFYKQKTYDDYVQLSSGMHADTHKDWQVCLGYDDQVNEIGVAAVSIPLQHAEQDRSLLFRATPFNGFMRFIARGSLDNAEILPAPFVQTETVKAAFIGQLLLTAGYDIRRFSTQPKQLRLQLADLVDGSNDSTITETVRTRSRDGVIASFTRTTRCIPAVGTNLTEGQGVDYASSLQATLEFDQPHTSQREQLVIAYDHADFIIPIPHIYKRILARKHSLMTHDAVDDETEIAPRETIDATTETLGRLSQDMVDVLLST